MFIEALQFILHLDAVVKSIAQEYALLAYVLLFLIIFFETGIVVTPFLPGDSLLFAVGALAASGVLRIDVLLVTVFVAAVLGDTLNYHIGKHVGPRVFRKENSFLFHKEHLIRAQAFYHKHGAKTIVIARFIPIIRTFAPFVAGIGVMKYRTFIGYNILGAFLWCTLFVIGGFLFGNIPFVQENFSLLIILIIVLSVIPLVKEFIVHVVQKKKKNAGNEKQGEAL